MSNEYFPVREMLFKTYVGNTLKYCITWLNWNPKDLAMVSKSDLVGYTNDDLNKVKYWREYKKEINYKSTFENYAKEKNINLTCTYVVVPQVVSHNVVPRVEDEMPELLEIQENLPYIQPEEPVILRVINSFIMAFIIILHIFILIAEFKGLF